MTRFLGKILDDYKKISSITRSKRDAIISRFDSITNTNIDILSDDIKSRDKASDASKRYFDGVIQGYKLSKQNIREILKD